MSTDFNLFLKPKIKLSDLRNELEKILSITFTEDLSFGSPEYRYEGLGLCLYLAGDHGFEDDLGINFTEYPFVVIVGAKTKVNMNYTLQRDFTLFLFELITTHYPWECILVEDMQNLLKQFPSKNKGE